MLITQIPSDTGIEKEASDCDPWAVHPGAPVVTGEYIGHVWHKGALQN